MLYRTESAWVPAKFIRCMRLFEPWGFLDSQDDSFFFFFFTLVKGPRRSLSLKLSDTREYEP